MATEIEGIKDITESILGIGDVSIDNFTFKLFYKWSLSFYIASFALVQANQFFGDPLACETADDSIDEDAITNYCYMFSKFLVPDNYRGFCRSRAHENTDLYNSYYQWVAIFFMVQAFLFYIPRCIWLSMEGGMMSFLVTGCLDRVVENAAEKQETLMRNYCEYVHNKFNKYAFGFFFCELLNVVITISQIFVTHAFLNYQYFDYGYLVYQYYSLDSETRSLKTTFNPMCEVFPNVVACNFHRFGKGGHQETKNAICILGLNIINSKVFALLWLWHCVLVPVGVVRILTRAFQLCSKHLRLFLLKFEMDQYISNNKQRHHIEHYILNCSIGDWFVLSQMNKNMNKRFFAEFVSALSMRVNPGEDVDEFPEINIIKNNNDDDENYYDIDEAGNPLVEEQNPHTNWKIPWRKRSTMFGKRKLSKKRK